MDQVKTGKFISELRKEKELTQTGLADIIGVSDKTVSKWECGRGMPEISTLPLLCETLGISVNELLSGERLEADTYTERAEENMVTLLKDSKTYNKDRSVLAIAVPIVFLLAVILLVSNSWSGAGSFAWIIDFPSLLFVFAVTTVFLISSGHYGDLWRAFKYAAGYGVPTEDRLKNAENAVKLSGKTMLLSGTVLTVISLIICFVMTDNTDHLLVSIAVSSIPSLYGLVGELLSLPIKARLRRRINNQL